MLIIGEKLSIIAKRVREAMMKKDKGPIQEIATRQWKEGSGVIDANIGPAEDGGEDLMQWMVTTIQEVVPLPICLDTTNFKAIEAGLKVHNNQWGRPLINSTSNDPERFPILELGAKYNACVIGLTVGKGGLPADAEERAGIAAEIMGRAMEYGVPLEDLYLDPLVLQIATSQDHARHVIKAIAMFQEMNDPAMKTVVGLSNISNGCPKTLRPILNKYYFMLLANEGLTAATEVAILSANYVSARLKNHYPTLYASGNGHVAHECILDLRPLKETSGVTAEDVAKRLMDYGFHAPTLSFPVPGTLMVEPTESETPDELDRFIDAMIAIRREIAQVERGAWPQDNNPLKNAPHTAESLLGDEWKHPYPRELGAFPVPELRDMKYWPPVGRIDNVWGDRNLFCSCVPVNNAVQEAP